MLDGKIIFVTDTFLRRSFFDAVCCDSGKSSFRWRSSTKVRLRHLGSWVYGDQSVTEKVYFLDEVTIFTDTPPDRSEFYASSEDDDYSVRLWLKDFDPYLENPASSFSFTWSVDVMNGSEELIGNNYTEGFCTRVSHHWGHFLYLPSYLSITLPCVDPPPGCLGVE